MPDGTGAINEAGLDFYDRLVDELLHAGIQPFATLYHWDLPQALQERWGGWIGRDTAAAFAAYADVVSRRLGDRVADWITVNEPWCSAWHGYGHGIHAPGLHETRLALQAAHHLLLGHGQAVPLLRRNSPSARVGAALDLHAVHTATDSPADQAAAYLADGLQNRWFLDPVFIGAYPADMLAHFGNDAPTVFNGDLETIAAPLDFLGVNYYFRSIISADSSGKHPAGERVHAVSGERTAMGWEVYPQGLYEVLCRVQRDYGPRALYVTENGAAFADVVTPDGAVHDDQRRAYLEGHVNQVRRAVVDGVPVRGYFVWSLLDNFEWAEGYGKRFGLVHVDYKTQERVIKDSGFSYMRMLQADRRAEPVVRR